MLYDGGPWFKSGSAANIQGTNIQKHLDPWNLIILEHSLCIYWNITDETLWPTRSSSPKYPWEQQTDKRNFVCVYVDNLSFSSVCFFYCPTQGWMGTLSWPMNVIAIACGWNILDCMTEKPFPAHPQGLSILDWSDLSSDAHIHWYSQKPRVVTPS